MVRAWLVALASAALTACAVGPDYVRPTVDTPAHFAQSDAGASSVTMSAEAPVVDEPVIDASGSTPIDTVDIWHRFDDPLLAQLVEDALAANHDLRIGLARWDEANALLRQARFDRVPTVTAGGTAANSRASESQLPGVPRDARDGEVFDARVDARWELDLFGRVRRQVTSQQALAEAAAADLRGLQVAIVGELATSYLRLRGTQARLEVARINADNQRETLRIVEARVDAGQGTAFDTARARAQLWSTLARIPALESAIALDMHRVAVLTGRTPDALLRTLKPVRDIPVLLSPPDPGTPGALLRRRPDIAAAERRLAAASERIGIATADLFPRLVFGGAIGSQALDADDLFERDSETRLISLGIDWSFLDAGRVRARIAAAQARADEHLAHYQQTVLRHSKRPRTRWQCIGTRTRKCAGSHRQRTRALSRRSWHESSTTAAWSSCCRCSTPSASSSTPKTGSHSRCPHPPSRWCASTARSPAAGRSACPLATSGLASVRCPDSRDTTRKTVGASSASTLR